MNPAPPIPSLVILDFDGVLTDNYVYVLGDGQEMVRCSREDSLGLSRLKARKVPVMILSTESSPVVAARARKLGLDLVQGCEDKASFLEEFLAKNSIDHEKAIYVGNDLNDLPAMRLVGCPACPADATDVVRQACRLKLSKKGGQGAVRELCELVIQAMDAEGVSR